MIDAIQVMVTFVDSVPEQVNFFSGVRNSTTESQPHIDFIRILHLLVIKPLLRPRAFALQRVAVFDSTSKASPTLLFHCRLSSFINVNGVVVVLCEVSI